MTVEDLYKITPVGNIIKGTITQHLPFGFFLNIGINEARGLVLIPTWHQKFPHYPFPTIGTEVEGIVLDIVESSMLEVRILPIFIHS